jgi:hypothetical protein
MTGMTEDDFLIYIARTQERAIALVPAIVRENCTLSGGNTIRNGDHIVGLIRTWRQVDNGHLSGIHGRVHVWAEGPATPHQRDQVSYVASHWLSHVEWV